ncbi:MAG: hypothetical protein IJ562_06620 [Prevotella sp.]|nr:hypothetical protein [Prevotella sp.]
MNKTKSFFNPFVGKEFEEHRVMILGEAHVCGECSCEECMKHKDSLCQNGHVAIVEKHIATGCVKTYRNLEKEFLGEAINDKSEREHFWNRILFTNLLPIAMPRGGQAPEEKYYTDDCRERFLNLIKTYHPKYLIVLGERTFNHLPGDESDMWQKEKVETCDDKFNIWTLNYEQQQVRVLQIYHPAWRGLSNEHSTAMMKRIRYFLDDTSLQQLDKANRSALLKEFVNENAIVKLTEKDVNDFLQCEGHLIVVRGCADKMKEALEQAKNDKQLQGYDLKQAKGMLVNISLISPYNIDCMEAMDQLNTFFNNFDSDDCKILWSLIQKEKQNNKFKITICFIFP